jgi:hypothetical protein
MESSGDISESFLMPSGVISNAHAKKIANGNPIIPKKKTAVIIHSDKCNAGTAVSVT